MHEGQDAYNYAKSHENTNLHDIREEASTVLDKYHFEPEALSEILADDSQNHADTGCFSARNEPESVLDSGDVLGIDVQSNKEAPNTTRPYFNEQQSQELEELQEVGLSYKDALLLMDIDSQPQGHDSSAARDSGRA
jgi:hypothetical protein